MDMVLLSSSLRPLSDRLVVRQIAEGDESRIGHLIVPATAVERPGRGVVEAVGPGRREADGRVRAMGLHVGDEVLVNLRSEDNPDFISFRLEDENFWLLGPQDLLAVVSKQFDGDESEHTTES